LLRIAAATAAAMALFMGIVYLRYSGDTSPDTWPSWFVGGGPTSTEQPVEVVFDESRLASANVAPQEACRLPWGWGSGGIITDPIDQTLRDIRLSNTCNRPDPSTAKATRSTWDTAYAIVQARGASITRVCEPQCLADDHTKTWIVEVHGTFVLPEQNYGRALVPDSIPVDASADAPIPGTWYSIIPVLEYCRPEGQRPFG
jgi:hypothetical protein